MKIESHNGGSSRIVRVIKMCAGRLSNPEFIRKIRRALKK